MATTATRWAALALGFRDSTGAVVASGKVRWYSPGTLTPAVAYSDAACTTPETAPLTLNAAGQGTLYFLEPVRVLVKDSTEATTYYDDIPPLVRHDVVYVTHASWNSGAETTLETILGTMATNLGADGKWLESVGATAIAYSTVLGQMMVPVTAFGAVGDGSTDDTVAIQAASDRVKARGGGWVYFPKGTYKISSPITIDTAGVNWRGAGQGVSVIKNFSTTLAAISISVSGTGRNTFCDFSITANTTSSANAISVGSGNFLTFERISTALHRGGFGTSSGTDATLRSIFVESTDDNASGVGVSLGTRSRISDSRISCGTANGTGIVASGNYSRVVDCSTSGFATSATLSGDDVQAIGCHFAGATTGCTVSGNGAGVRDCNSLSTTGFSLTGVRVKAVGCTADSGTTGFSLGATGAATVACTALSCTTGFSVGAFASCKVVACDGVSNTTDLSVNASATLLIEHSNTFSTLSDSATTPHSWMKDRAKVAKITPVTHSTTTPTITPTPQSCDVYVANLTSAGAVSSCTVANTATTGLVDGQRMTLIIQRTAGTGTPTISWGSQYGIAAATMAVPASGTAWKLPFVWRTSTSLAGSNIWALENVAVAATTNNTADW